MKKIAFFVEGQTEQLFIEKLLSEVFDYKKIAIEVKKIRGGKKVPISITAIVSPTVSSETSYYVLIYDCGGDSNIRSYIQDQRESLINSGYKKIIGIRDVYPDFKREEIHRLLYGLNFKLPQKDLSIKFILSVMEIESWFLAEQNHYLKINTTLTPEFILTNAKFNPSTFDTELIDEPALKLNEVYMLAGEKYKKENAIISRTINSIDYANLYFEVHKRISSLNELIEEINKEID